MTTLGKIEEFDVRSGKIDRHIERVEQYFEANKIPSDSETSHQQRAILISVLGAEAYDTLCNLCSPHSASLKSFDDLKVFLNRILHPVASTATFPVCVNLLMSSTKLTTLHQWKILLIPLLHHCTRLVPTSKLF